LGGTVLAPLPPTHWNLPLIRRILFVSMSVAIISSFIGIPTISRRL